MTEISFGNWMNIQDVEQLFEKIDKIIKKWIKSKDLDIKDKLRFFKVIYDFHCLPSTSLHNEWKEYRKLEKDNKRNEEDINKLEKIKRWIDSPVLESNYHENVILGEINANLLRWQDNLLIISKEFGTFWENNQRKFCYINEEYIFESQYPITYNRCKMNLNKKNY